MIVAREILLVTAARSLISEVKRLATGALLEVVPRELIKPVHCTPGARATEDDHLNENNRSILLAPSSSSWAFICVREIFKRSSTSCCRAAVQIKDCFVESYLNQTPRLFFNLPAAAAAAFSKAYPFYFEGFHQHRALRLSIRKYYILCPPGHACKTPNDAMGFFCLIPFRPPSGAFALLFRPSGK